MTVLDDITNKPHNDLNLPLTDTLDQSSSFIRTIDKISMFAIGTINNFFYVIGIASSIRILKQFDNSYDLSFVVFADSFSGCFARFLNDFLLSYNFSYEFSYFTNCVIMLIGLIGCGLSKNFWLTLFFIFFIGFSSSYGESVVLCYLAFKRKQPLFIYWCSGTGMAGILGASYSLLCEYYHINYEISFFVVSPVVIVYFLLFFLIIRKSPEEIYNIPLAQDDSKASFCQSSIFSRIWKNILNCSIVYFF
jgi:hypothetical protein